ncbi:MAG: BioD-like phosphotransacetylase family protein, partial [Candidatus Omnitrophota bacterium]
MKKPLKNIFISSIHQNAGKTTICLGLFKALKSRRIKASFIKPVGQELVDVGNAHIDKDSYLIGEVFKTNKQYDKMSPVTIPRGFTEEYITKPDKEKIKNKILDSFNFLKRDKSAMIVEGTGHAGVGAVIDHSNADVAALLGSKAIIISGGGIGKCIDEIMLNKALFDQSGVEIIGVIVNKVRQDKYDKIKKVLGKGLENKGIKLLGVIPLQPLMSSPTINQVKSRLGLEVLCGKEGTQRRVTNTIVAAMEPHNMIHYLKPGTLVITSGDRVDNILLAVSSHLVKGGNKDHISGIILTGGLMPNPKIIDLLRKSDIPVLISDHDTYAIAA